MKLWELDSICRGDPSVLTDVLSEPKWRNFADQFAGIDAAIEAQDRGFLDQLLPSALVQEVLQRLRKPIYFDGEQLRSYRLDASDQTFSPLDVYLQYGGSALEDILEKGSLSVERAQRAKPT